MTTSAALAAAHTSVSTVASCAQSVHGQGRALASPIAPPKYPKLAVNENRQEAFSGADEELYLQDAEVVVYAAVASRARSG